MNGQTSGKYLRTKQFACLFMRILASAIQQEKYFLDISCLCAPLRNGPKVGKLNGDPVECARFESQK